MLPLATCSEEFKVIWSNVIADLLPGVTAVQRLGQRRLTRPYLFVGNDHRFGMKSDGDSRRTPNFGST